MTFLSHKRASGGASAARSNAAVVRCLQRTDRLCGAPHYAVRRSHCRHWSGRQSRRTEHKQTAHPAKESSTGDSVGIENCTSLNCNGQTSSVKSTWRLLDAAQVTSRSAAGHCVKNCGLADGTRCAPSASHLQQLAEVLGLSFVQNIGMDVHKRHWKMKSPIRRCRWSPSGWLLRKV